MPDTGCDRGPMIVYTEEEWRRRSDLQRRRLVRLQTVVIAGFMSLPVLILIAIVMVPEARGDPFITTLLVLCLGISAALIGFCRMLLNWFDRGPLMGLYENGFQYDFEVFYPYEEIDRVELGEDGLRMWLKVGPGSGPNEWGPSKRVVTLFETEGIEALKKRVHVPGSPE